MKSKQLLYRRKENNLVFLFSFLVSILFIVGCSNNSDEDFTPEEIHINSETQVTKNYNIITNKGTLIANYTIKEVKKNNTTTWSGNFNIADTNLNIIFELSYKSSVKDGDNYKHTFEDTKSNKIVFTTDMSLGNPILVKNESSLTGYTFS